MKTASIQTPTKKKFKATTSSYPNLPMALNALQMGLKCPNAGRVLLTISIGVAGMLSVVIKKYFLIAELCAV